MTDLPTGVKVKEVGPRDGLQAESEIPAIGDKLRLMGCPADAGLREIEATSFVSPKAIPAFADAAGASANLDRRPGVAYSAIVPNEKGTRRAVGAGADEIQVFLPASRGGS